MDADSEQYILLLLSDGNLPTGSFVASSGLESYVKHGFLAATSYGEAEKATDFMRYSLESYSSSALPFVTDTHHVVSRTSAANGSDQGLDRCLQRIAQLDALYDAMTLNHVTKRASRAQGVALLTLFSKGFIRPKWLTSEDSDKTGLSLAGSSVEQLINRLKLETRQGKTHGHLPICWGVLTAALGLSAERSQHLHLFLHARGLLSAAIRMNVLGPYAAQQLLLHVVRPLVDSEIVRCKSLQTGMSLSAEDTNRTDSGCNPESTVDGPATTWPLGEILAARHDLQHSRIFNS